MDIVVHILQKMIFNNLPALILYFFITFGIRISDYGVIQQPVVVVYLSVFRDSSINSGEDKGIVAHPQNGGYLFVNCPQATVVHLAVRLFLSRVIVTETRVACALCR